MECRMEVFKGQVVQVIQKQDTGWWFVTNGANGHGWVPASLLSPLDRSKRQSFLLPSDDEADDDFNLDAAAAAAVAAFNGEDDTIYSDSEGGEASSRVDGAADDGAAINANGGQDSGADADGASAGAGAGVGVGAAADEAGMPSITSEGLPPRSQSMGRRLSAMFRVGGGGEQTHTAVDRVFEKYAAAVPPYTHRHFLARALSCYLPSTRHTHTHTHTQTYIYIYIQISFSFPDLCNHPPSTLFQRHIVIKNHSPNEPDEVELVKGSVVKVSEKRMDGWWEVVLPNGNRGRAPAVHLKRLAMQAYTSTGRIQTLAPLRRRVSTVVGSRPKSMVVSSTTSIDIVQRRRSAPIVKARRKSMPAPPPPEPPSVAERKRLVKEHM